MHVDVIARPAGRGQPAWSCIVPFYNEAPYLVRTLRALMAQGLPAHLILVDNGSTDGSACVARALTAGYHWPVTFLHEGIKGKVAALARGLAEVTTPYVATCDADTFYPPDYLATAQVVLERPGCVAAGAMLVSAPGRRLKAALEVAHWRLAALAAPWQCHTGGAGQAFRTAALRDVGGFCVRRWNLVLEDHEIFARMLTAGRLGYAADHWCSPAARAHRTGRVGWHLREQLAYHATSRARMPGFFADYLRPRLIRRGQLSEVLRADVRLAC